MNNLDAVILIVIGISALIGLSRGLVKEVLSIIGWTLACCVVVFFVPMVLPLAEKFIDSPKLAMGCVAIAALIIFFIFWGYLSGKAIAGIKTSKLGNLDRLLGLFFGVARAFLLVILFNILINWIIPTDAQAPVLKRSKYFALAGNFAQPIEQLIPKQTLEQINKKAAKVKKMATPEEEAAEKDEELSLFEKLAAPKVAKKGMIIEDLDNKKKPEKEYKDTERQNLDRLIENATD